MEKDVTKKAKTVVWTRAYTRDGTCLATAGQLWNKGNVYTIRKVVLCIPNLDGTTGEHVQYEYSVSPKRTSWHTGFASFAACKRAVGWRLAAV